LFAAALGPLDCYLHETTPTPRSYMRYAASGSHITGSTRRQTMKYHWPPKPLGLGPPLNVVTLSPQHHDGLKRRALQSIVFAVAAAIVIAAIDQFFFEGETARRTPALDAHPTPLARVTITFIGGLLEELFFRVLFATAMAALVWSVLRGVVGERTGHVAAAQWTGTIAAAIFVGVWHVWLVSDPASSDARVLVVNAVGNLLYGWTYWRRGLEMSTLTHGTLNATLFLGLPLIG
jgi:membrane protease YdiL (CAAX protease family)